MSSRLGGLGLHRCSSLRVALALLGLGVAVSGCVFPGTTALLGSVRLGGLLLPRLLELLPQLIANPS